MAFSTKINIVDGKTIQYSSDTLTLSGITKFGNTEYITGMSSNFNEKTLTSVDFVTGITNDLQLQINETITGATNGLTKSNRDVELGGNLTSDTTINTNGNELSIGGAYSNVKYYDQSVILTGSDGVGLSGSIIFDNNNPILITGDSSFQGLLYDSDYSSNYSDRSLVDKGYVDLLVSGATGEISGATNGLSITNKNVVLGGALTGNTEINVENGDLSWVYGDDFNIGTGFNNIVKDISIQSDDKILIGGLFTEYSGESYNRIIRLNSDSSIDSTFEIGSGFNGDVNVIKIQPDDKILVGGVFTEYSGESYNRIIRLNSDGSIDSTFEIGGGFNNGVNTINVQSDGKILVGGIFTEYSGESYNRIIRLNSDG
ncbi:MAG: delta-60 repeat domain-containing protein, partial [bacterium]